MTRPLVLLLEDLHWSDSATIDLLGMLARRREASRLLVLGTYRPADVAATGASICDGSSRSCSCTGTVTRFPLEFLSAAAVDEYLSRRFPGHALPVELARVLHRNTDGNPLFLVNTVDDLIVQGQLRDDRRPVAAVRTRRGHRVAGAGDAVAAGGTSRSSA